MGPEHVKASRVGKWYLGQPTALTIRYEPAPLYQKLPNGSATGLAVLQDKMGIYARADEGRLYGEVPAPLTKNKAQKVRGASATDPQDGFWKLLGIPTMGSLILWRRSIATRRSRALMDVEDHSDSGAERAAHMVQTKAGCTGRCLQPGPR